jgi:transcription-repair coupling factor (superfamily II helicase)
MNELLLDYGFERVDFVYEPGQFAIRGGILDVFSFANDYPFRMEFFGEELESIRTFNPVDQLSISTHEFFNIVPNVQKQFIQHGLETFLTFLGKNVTVWMSSMGEITNKLDKEYDKAVAIYEKLNHTVKQTLPGDLYTHKSEWTKEVENYSVIEWGPEFHFTPTFEQQFQVQQQPAFNKNFELLREDLIERKKVGFTNLFFSNQPKQIDRLYSIFEDFKFLRSLLQTKHTA